MKIAVFSAKAYDRRYLDQENKQYNFEIAYFELRLTAKTALLARGFDAVCVFVNDVLDKETLQELQTGGTRFIALRCAGFNNVDLEMAEACGLRVVRVPAYSPYAVAEHAVALLLALNRKIHRAHNRVREGNFSLEGLLGFDLHGKTVGVIGLGRIGVIFSKIMRGFGCRVIAYDAIQKADALESGISYVELPELFKQSDIISLHCPLTPETHHLIDESAIAQFKKGVAIINTSRGPLIDTRALIKGLKSEHIGYVGLDVYEEESDLFFEDLSCRVIQDDVFARLQTFPNVIITGHQAFFTENALNNIAATTLNNLQQLYLDEECLNVLTTEVIRK